MHINNVDTYLRDHGIKPSYQRKRVLEYIIEHHNHPTVSQIYDDLIDDIPTLSKTTVYNTLNLFAEKKIVEVITIEGNEARYDIFNPKPHAHFKCDKCQTLYDINLDFSKIANEDLKDYIVKDQYIHFRGTCPNCSKRL
ncbi:Fur family transcriptional regulator [Clostridium amazonitimonense]|uniref:Fur family transcriptional regulator n=1 Tax=Clostridium amazonitimonense TaxID=1499689 RepID=UPI0005097C3D|nr:Fur family transcriptional regulator [Clostridium amazonitimonense]